MKFAGMRAVLLLSLPVALACSKTDTPAARSLLDAKIKCANQGREYLARLGKEQEPFGVSVSLWSIRIQREIRYMLVLLPAE